MDQILQKKLYEEYPRFFNRTSPPVRGGFWGFECGNGWYALLSKLCEDLSKVVSDDFQVLQVKEKFGTLRFYVANSNRQTEDLIDKAEAASGHTCEECGEPGKLTGKGWLRTACEFHEK